MARVIKGVKWDEDAQQMYNSHRRYDVYEITAIATGEDAWDADRSVTLRLYVDELTGVVVKDIAAYERSLK